MRVLAGARVWRGTDGPTLEHFRLWRLDDGWSLEGAVVGRIDAAAASVRYEVVVDRAWVTRSAIVRQARGDETTTIQLRIEAGQRWWFGGSELEHLRGYRDVDLGITPATNTLPIRRLRLEPGGEAEVVATWLRFPSLEIRPLRQTYRRIDEYRYRYRSEGGFEAELTVDEHGVVARYGDLWETIASE